MESLSDRQALVSIMPFHILAGAVGIVSGFVALYVTKGGGLHRKSGTIFVYVMVTMALSGAGIAASRGGRIAVIGGLLTAYLVVTGLTTLRAPTAASRRVDTVAMLVALAMGLAAVGLGFQVQRSPTGTSEGIPAAVFFVHGAVALLASLLDLRMIRAGGLSGAPRLARHLWRMCFGLWMASASFFLGQADVIPAQLRIPVLLAIPVIVPLLAIFYWLWRIRWRQSLRGLKLALIPKEA